MHQEKQNSISQKLDQLNALPEGFSFDPQRTWTKLQPELKKEKQWMIPALIAAASIVVIVLVTGINQKKEPPIDRTASSLPSKTETKNSSAPSKTPVQNKIVEVENAKRIKHQFPVKVNKEDDRTRNIEPAIVYEPEPSVIQQDPVVAIVQQVKPAEKKRYPIAHVNDLNKPEEVVLPEPSGPKPAFSFRKHNYEELTPATSSFEELAREKKRKSIFPIINSSN